MGRDPGSPSSYEGDRLGEVQCKHIQWLRLLLSFGAAGASHNHPVGWTTSSKSVQGNRLLKAL